MNLLLRQARSAAVRCYSATTSAGCAEPSPLKANGSRSQQSHRCLDRVLRDQGHTRILAKMAFIITRHLAQLPSYAVLCKLAEQNRVNVIGNEQAGTFQGQGGNGDYEFGADYVRGNFSAS